MFRQNLRMIKQGESSVVEDGQCLMAICLRYEHECLSENNQGLGK